MSKNRLKKIALLTALSSMLITGCGKKESNTVILDEPKTEAPKTEYDLDLGVVSNQTMAKIMEEYRAKADKYARDDDFVVHEDYEPFYEFEYVRCNYRRMYIVKVNIHKDGEKWYMPISALLETEEGEIVNVKVYTLDDQNRVHEPFEDYIYIDNPTMENYDEMRKGEAYINAKYQEPAFYLEYKKEK